LAVGRSPGRSENSAPDVEKLLTRLHPHAIRHHRPQGWVIR
jgi:hypothetical protein